MRLDKYLKVSRLIKRRTVAKEISSSERVYINNRIAKPSSTVNIGDEIKIVYGSKEINIKVLSIQENAKKELANQMYEIISEENTTAM